MGCDIHAFVEVKQDSGEWKLVEDKIFPDPYFSEEETPRVAEPFGARHYGRFAILAGVRNYSDVEPIAEPRGIPDDVSEGVREEVEVEWEGDGHSHSYFTLAELLAFDWERSIWDKRDEVTTTYRELAGEDFFADIETMKTLGEPERVRVVFFFDN